ncbi:hypothetical protein [Undibacterium sp. RuRC25W]|uniref:hypothetical protein n=1 Tax=Undibacterium sp. RuRC25W TaxID=3413047 RepID=UPI003BF257C8
MSNHTYFQRKVRPLVLIANRIGRLASNSHFSAAKTGDDRSAVCLINEVLQHPFIDDICSAIAGANAILQPVLGMEAGCDNKIPLALSTKLSGLLDVRHGLEIVQSTVSLRSSANGLDRLFTRPWFDGQVEGGRNYFIVDDTLSQGGTILSLINFIESHGANVIGYAVLSGKQYSAQLSLSNFTLEVLREKYGTFESDFISATGYGFDSLTESEARYISKINSLDAFRDRIAEAKDEEGS